MKETIFYNGFNLLVDLIIFSLTAFFFYRSGIRRGFYEGMEAEAEANPYIDLDTHWEGAIK